MAFGPRHRKRPDFRAMGLLEGEEISRLGPSQRANDARGNRNRDFRRGARESRKTAGRWKASGEDPNQWRDLSLGARSEPDPKGHARR